MTRHCAAALLCFAVWQAAILLSLPPGANHAALPWAGLVVLMLVMVPLAQGRERTWQLLSRGTFTTPQLLAEHRRDRACLWLLAFALPPVWTLLALGILHLFG